MTTERFSRDRFEEVLRKIAEPLSVTHMGMVHGEHRYNVYVGSDVFIYVNSSVGVDNFADSTGANSIRLWIGNAEGKPLAKKDQDYVTRIAGWERRLAATYKVTLTTASELLSAPRCPRCGSNMVRRTRRSDGNPFWGCKNFPRCNGSRDITDVVTLQAKIDEVRTPAVVQHNDEIVPDVPVKKFEPSIYQQAVFQWVIDRKTGKGNGNNALFVEAVAGSGKTTTGVEMLKLLPASQQTLFVAFNKHIALELQKRAPSYVHVSTYHSLGYAAIRSYSKTPVTVDEDKVSDILAYLFNKDLWKHTFPVIRSLVSLVKANLSSTDPETLLSLADHYGIELNGDEEMILEAVPAVIERCRKQVSRIDYDDMCWLPIVLNMTMRQYDNIFIDEAQDTNKVQIELALKSVKPGGLIIAVGDRYQSLYGFRGADVDAIPNLISRLHADTLPLSITYRCPKSVVKFVNDEFGHIKFEAPAWAKDGSIRSIKAQVAISEYKPGDMVLCRTNAPLVSPAFELIRKGIKAIIRGRDIGKGLITLVRKMKSETIVELLSDLKDYKQKEVGKLLAAEKNTQAQALTDKVDTIVALSDGVYTLVELESRINTIFSDDAEGVVFSSVHRAKGLEAERVYILRADLMPHPMAKRQWEKDQEENIRYVAYTRSLNELIFVEGE